MQGDEDGQFITMVAGERTRPQDLHFAGRRIPLEWFRGLLIPGPGTAGTLHGVPGVMRENLEWEMTEPAPLPPDPGPPWAQAISAKLEEIKRLLTDTPENRSLSA